MCFGSLPGFHRHFGNRRKRSGLGGVLPEKGQTGGWRVNRYGVFFVVVCGRVWSCVVMCGRVWSCVVICGRVWSCVVVCGRMWPWSCVETLLMSKTRRIKKIFNFHIKRKIIFLKVRMICIKNILRINPIMNLEVGEVFIFLF